MKISIVGSGNVATHLAKNLFNNGVQIIDVFSLNINNANQLALEVNARGVDQINELKTDVDLVIVSVKDDFVGQVSSQIDSKIPIVHTSGSVDMSALNSHQKFGILYPLQTFSKNKNVKMSEVPFLLEANSAEFYQEIEELCTQYLSVNIYKTNSGDRASIHLAAVITNNFSTQLLVEAHQILAKKGISLQILKPLLLETMNKAFDLNPKQALTGPAKRGDVQVIEKQKMAIDNEKLKQVYQLMSELIMEQNSSNF